MRAAQDAARFRGRSSNRLIHGSFWVGALLVAGDLQTLDTSFVNLLVRAAVLAVGAVYHR